MPSCMETRQATHQEHTYTVGGHPVCVCHGLVITVFCQSCFGHCGGYILAVSCPVQMFNVVDKGLEMWARNDHRCCWSAALPDPFPIPSRMKPPRPHGRTMDVGASVYSTPCDPARHFPGLNIKRAHTAKNARRSYMHLGLIGSSTAMAYCSKVCRIACVWLLAGAFASPQPANAEPTWPFFP